MLWIILSYKFNYLAISSSSVAFRLDPDAAAAAAAEAAELAQFRFKLVICEEVGNGADVDLKYFVANAFKMRSSLE